jgi:hypothetical protein
MSNRILRAALWICVLVPAATGCGPRATVCPMGAPPLPEMSFSAGVVEPNGRVGTAVARAGEPVEIHVGLSVEPPARLFAEVADFSRLPMTLTFEKRSPPADSLYQWAKVPAVAYEMRPDAARSDDRQSLWSTNMRLVFGEAETVVGGVHLPAIPPPGEYMLCVTIGPIGIPYYQKELKWFHLRSRGNWIVVK